MAEEYKRRSDDRIYRLLGMSFRDYVQIGIVICALAMAYAKFQLLVESTDYLLGFAENSDRYHSSVSGAPFKQGEPARNRYDAQGFRVPLPKTK